MLFSSKFVVKFASFYGVELASDNLKKLPEYSETKNYSFIEDEDWITIYENVKPEERVSVTIKYNLPTGEELIFNGKVKEVLDVNGKVMLFPRRIFNQAYGYSLPIGSEITISFKN